MKIGLLTQPLGHNYGGVLQALALKTVLERMGHEVVLFDWYSRIPLRFYRVVPDKIATRKIRRFVRKHFDRRYICRGGWNENAVRGLDAVVVGSDQVWRPIYNRGGMIGHNFLDFCTEAPIRRVAYAASFGTDVCEFTPSQISVFRPLLQKFDGVSVREDSGVALCRELFGVEAQHLLDPTLLLDKEDYMSFAGISPSDTPQGGLLSYILDRSEETDRAVADMARERGLRVIRVNSQYENREAPLKDRIQPPVEGWLRAFYDADFVVADSFHAAVFAIIFGKPFKIIINPDRGAARIESLLRLFGCQDNMIESISELDICGIETCKTEASGKALNSKRVENSNNGRKLSAVKGMVDDGNRDEPLVKADVNEVLKRERAKSYGFIDKYLKEISGK